MTLDLYLIVGPFISSKVIKDQLLLLRHQLAGSAFVPSFVCLFSHPSNAILSHLYFITNRGLHNMRHFRGYIAGKTVSNLYIKIHNKAIQVKNVQTTDV